MSAEIIKKRFTVHDYHRMGKAGILGANDRVELIDGEIIEMTPIGRRHWVRVNRASDLLARAFSDKGMVSTQSSLKLGEWTEPQPDIVVFKRRADFYAAKDPAPEDVLLVVEVSDTSLDYDRNVKVPLFAAAGIVEVWIQDAKRDILHIYRIPQSAGYSNIVTLHRGDVVSPLAAPEISLSIEDLLGDPIVEK